MGSDEHSKDRADVLRFVDDALERSEIGPEVAEAVKRILRGPRAYRPQAVSQALISFIVNHRSVSSGNPLRYFLEMVEEQQERLYGKPRKDT